MVAENVLVHDYLLTTYKANASENWTDVFFKCSIMPWYFKLQMRKDLRCNYWLLHGYCHEHGKLENVTYKACWGTCIITVYQGFFLIPQPSETIGIFENILSYIKDRLCYVYQSLSFNDSCTGSASLNYALIAGTSLIYIGSTQGLLSQQIRGSHDGHVTVPSITHVLEAHVLVS